MESKPIVWLGRTLRAMRALEKTDRTRAGRQLRLLQSGLAPADWQGVPSIGPGAMEVRIHTRREIRLIVVADLPEAVYVLHVFEKKTQRIPTRTMRVAESRYGQMLALRGDRR